MRKDGQTDMTKLIVALLNFAKGPKMFGYSPYIWEAPDTRIESDTSYPEEELRRVYKSGHYSIFSGLPIYCVIIVTIFGATYCKILTG
jgi:hypothetical protein